MTNAEQAACHLWGILMALRLEKPDDPHIKAAFLEADRVCREAGLIQPRPGVRFKDAA